MHNAEYEPICFLFGTHNSINMTGCNSMQNLDLYVKKLNHIKTIDNI